MITEHLVALSARWKQYGYRRLHIMLQREGIKINHKRTYRLYKAAGLALKKRNKKKNYEKRGMPERAITQQMHVGRWISSVIKRDTEQIFGYLQL
jgi:putative transposase